jgi:hypothetical protein
VAAASMLAVVVFMLAKRNIGVARQDGVAADTDFARQAIGSEPTGLSK